MPLPEKPNSIKVFANPLGYITLFAVYGLELGLKVAVM